MNNEEVWAREFLLYRGFQIEEIIFEPNGPGTFPDFLVEGRIGVEVRRLNKYLRTSTDDEPIEKLSKPRFCRMTKLLESFRRSSNGVSWYVDYNFKRPQLTEDWENILRKKLEPFQAGQVQTPQSVIQIDDNFWVELYRRSETADVKQENRNCFTLIGLMDLNTGGWPNEDVTNSLSTILQEKTAKRLVAFKQHPNTLSYSEWWLVLVDHITAGTPRSVVMKHDWDKVIVIHPDGYERAYEV